MKYLNSLRKKINKIDNNLLKLISKRFEICKKIGKFKNKNNIKIYDKKREKLIFKNLKEKSKKYKLNEKCIEKVFKIIIKNSREIQINKNR